MHLSTDPQLYQLLAGWPWRNHLTSLCLSSLICKMGVIVPVSQRCCLWFPQDNAQEGLRRLTAWRTKSRYVSYYCQFPPYLLLYMYELMEVMIKIWNKIRFCAVGPHRVTVLFLQHAVYVRFYNLFCLHNWLVLSKALDWVMPGIHLLQKICNGTKTGICHLQIIISVGLTIILWGQQDRCWLLFTDRRLGHRRLHQEPF